MSDSQWEEVGAEAAADRDYAIFRFNAVGDQAVGKLVKVVENIPGTYGPETHYIFEKPDGKFGINPNADLRKRLTGVTVGNMLRITYVSDKDINKPSPMKVFRVERYKGGASAPKANAPF